MFSIWFTASTCLLLWHLNTRCNSWVSLINKLLSYTYAIYRFFSELYSSLSHHYWILNAINVKRQIRISVLFAANLLSPVFTHQSRNQTFYNPYGLSAKPNVIYKTLGSNYFKSGLIKFFCILLQTTTLVQGVVKISHC